MPLHPFFERIVEISEVLGNVLVPVAGALISYFETKDAWREKRIRDFSNASEFSPEDRGEYAEDCLQLYRKQYAEEIARGGHVGIRGRNRLRLCPPRSAGPTPPKSLVSGPGGFEPGDLERTPGRIRIGHGRDECARVRITRGGEHLTDGPGLDDPPRP